MIIVRIWLSTLQNFQSYRVASRVSERLKAYDLRKLGNISKVRELHRIIAYCPVPLPK